MYDILNLPDTQFPKDFLWGSATAGHQVEGDNINSQWWHWEQKPEWTRGNPDRAPSGKACDHWERYRDDVELLASLGHQAYRFSIEWSRIEPEQGRWDEPALARYLDLLERLKGKGIRAFVTLHHFTHPQWFELLGGFNKAENVARFERFVAWVVPRIAPLVDGWCVINEFNLPQDADAGMRKLNFLRAHARGYHIIKQHSAAPVSSAHAFVHWFPRRWNDPLDKTLTAYVDWVTHEFFLHAVRTGEFVYPGMDAVSDPEFKDTCDYWAVNYYTRHMVDARCARKQGARFRHVELKMIPQNFYLEEMFPEGLISWMERLSDRPIYITENGCACDDDAFRIAYLALHFCALREAMERGADVRGYFYWSLLDNYEWGSFVPRFGLVDVDRATFARTPKPSAHFYREIIRAGGMSRALVNQYLKRVPTLRAR